MGKQTIPGLSAKDLDFLAELNESFTLDQIDEKDLSKDCGGKYTRRCVRNWSSRNMQRQKNARRHAHNCPTCQSALEGLGHR